jgi:hypothetical protein
MKKLKLNLDELAVETFTTADHSVQRGTVAAHNTFACITLRCQDSNLCTGLRRRRRLVRRHLW